MCFTERFLSPVVLSSVRVSPAAPASGPAPAMKAPLFLLAVAIATTVAVALPVQWHSLEKATASQPRIVGDVYKFCNKSLDPLVIDKVTLSPDPPVKGQDLTISWRYFLEEEVTGGEVKVEVKYGIIPVFDETLQICDLLPQIGMKCPVPKGPGSNSTTVSIPSDIPGGHYTGSAVATDQNGKQLACIDLDIHF